VDKAVWFYMVGDDKEGPISHNELQGMLDKGDVDSSTRVWTQSQDEWLPISEVEHFNMTTLDETPTIEIQKKGSYARETDEDYIRSRPWVRFWARMIDYSLFIIVLSIFIGYFSIGLGVISSYTGMLAIFLWVFVEAFLLATVGTTPGKWFLRVSVRNENHQKLSFSGGLNRSFSVWWLGMGAGLPIISLITMIVAAVKLNSAGVTSWDRRSDLRISHGKIGIVRTLIVILFFLCYAWVVSWGQLQMMNQQ
jgi:uncharacterized RDD family membrane protein YckC